MKLRPFHFRLRSFAAAGFATLLALAGGAFLATTPASAVADGVTALGSFAVSPTTLPTLTTGGSAQAGSDILFSIPSIVTTNDVITLQVQPHSSANCLTSSSDFVGFNNSVPITATATGSGHPTFAVSLGTAASDPAACAAVNDVLTLTLTNNSGTGPFPVTVTGIEYNVGATADPGNIGVGVSSTTTTPTTTTFFTPSAGTASPPSDATVAAHGATVTADNPVVTVTNNGGTGTISNIVVTEAAAGAVHGSLCIAPNTAPSSPTVFTFTGAGTTTAAGGSAVVGASSLPGGAILVLITTPSVSATTYTISAATVATSGATTGPATVTVTTGGANCGADTTGFAAGLVVFGVAPTLHATIAGADIDGTAIAEMAAAFPSGCPSSHKVILATDQNFPDALAASYLAGFLQTGILLTPTASLSAETQNALQNDGITQVYVVGGPLAVSQNTITQVNATLAYTCGGPASGTKTGSNISVVQTLFGTTQYDTAQAIGLFPPSSNVHSFNLSGAYSNQYNGTTGNESSSPSAVGAIRTAIVASGANFPDASSASVLAYNNQFPLVLTDPNSLSGQAQTTLQSLGIQQVIVLGGPLAVSNADVTSIIGLGISVIRVAGQDATDTSQDLASFELQVTTQHAGLGWSSTWLNKILVARGDFYSDALAGCVLAVLHTTPLLLTESPTTPGPYLTAFLNAGGSAAGIDGLNLVTPGTGDIQTIQLLGGPLAMFLTTLQAMAAAVAAG